MIKLRIRWKRSFAVALLFFALILIVGSWLMLIQQKDPVIQIGMPLEEVLRLNGKPNRLSLLRPLPTGSVFGDTRRQECWQRGRHVTIVDFESHGWNDTERVSHVEHETLSLSTYLNEQVTCLRQQLGI